MDDFFMILTASIVSGLFGFIGAFIGLTEVLVQQALLKERGTV